ncbi:MAG: dethiobiotin synthase [Candidatus Thioglobus sp.]|nr:MAG: dethiobiotin synthase [Candidatus Thioglobus sp.]
MKGLFISGSGTDVGKTTVASHIIKALRGKYNVVARKPVESACLKGVDGLLAQDALRLNAACANPEAIDVVCRFKFEACASGEKASKQQGEVISLQDLLQSAQPTDDDDFVVIEGAGGIYSPIAKQILNSDFAASLGLPLVIVVADELGAINQSLLAIGAAKKCGIATALLVLNQIKPNNLGNAEALRAYTDVEVVVFNTDKLAEFEATIVALIQQR